MGKDEVIVITGAAGFIGSALITYLNQLGYEHLILVDDFSNEKKVYNLVGKKYRIKVHREQFFHWLQQHPDDVRYIFHLGARTDTTDKNYEIFKTLNLEYSKSIWAYCSRFGIPLVYASSAATYGDGSLGFTDDETQLELLRPLNPYAVSKNEFDIWALEQKNAPPCWYGLKFFNVFGPNEYHKGRMASVVYHAYRQVLQHGRIRLFRSHRPDYGDGEQMRDFIYVKDVIAVCVWLLEQTPTKGIYNLGTGKARSFNDLAKSVFSALNLPDSIQYIDTPEDIRDSYQYHTEADMRKLRAAGYTRPFYSLEKGVEDYLQFYLEAAKYY